MAFCLDHSENSAEITYIIAQSLDLLDTPLQKKLARMYLINDILYNSSLLTVPAAWSYRKYFEAKLPEMVENLNRTYLETTSAANEAAKEKILKLLKLWNDWSVYEQRFLAGLQAIFLKKKNHFGIDPLIINPNGPTSFIRESSPLGVKLKILEDELNQSSIKDLEKFCRTYGLSTRGTKRDMIERGLIMREYDLKYNKESLMEGISIRSEPQEKKKKTEITVDLIKQYNSKYLTMKQPQNLGLHEIEKIISDGTELLNFIQKRNEAINEKDPNGVPLDELDFALYDLPTEDTFEGKPSYSDLIVIGEEIQETDIPNEMDFDGEPLTENELLELSKMNLVFIILSIN